MVNLDILFKTSRWKREKNNSLLIKELFGVEMIGIEWMLHSPCFYQTFTILYITCRCVVSNFAIVFTAVQICRWSTFCKTIQESSNPLDLCIDLQFWEYIRLMKMIVLMTVWLLYEQMASKWPANENRGAMISKHVFWGLKSAFSILDEWR